MKRFGMFLCGILLLSTFSSCSDDSTRVCDCGQTNVISGRVLDADSLKAVEGAAVFMAEGHPLAFLDTAVTNSLGLFQFNNVSEGQFYFFAGVLNGPANSSFSHISPISTRIDYPGEGIFSVGNLLLYGVSAQSSIAGRVVYAWNGAPSDSADVILFDLSSWPYAAVDSVLTDRDGNYSFGTVETGNYCIWAGKPLEYITAESGHFFCDGVTSYAFEVLELQGVPVRKPAIYIYPDEDAHFRVQLILNNGTTLTHSIPEYGSGWNVFVEESGKIDHHYDYLFYEASLQYVPVLSDGWCISRNELPNELRRLVLEIGLNDIETNDLLEYWLDQLTRHEYYAIYPVFDHSLNDMAELRVTPEPDTVLRFWLFFKGCKDLETLPLPQTPDFDRRPTAVVEWGGVLLN